METTAEALAAARRCHEAGLRARAEQLYEQVLDVDPTNAQALFQLGILAVELGKSEAAIDWLTRALKFDPLQPAIHVTLGEAHRRRGHIPEAMACNRQAIVVQESFFAAHANLGLLHLQQGNLTEAEVFLRRAVELAPQIIDCRYHWATVLQLLEKFDAASECYREVLARRPDDLETHVNLGGCLQRLHKHADAESQYRRALGIDPNFAPAHNNLGALLADAHQYEEAAFHCRRAIELRPQVASAYTNLAKALQELGRPDEAIDACRRGIEKDARVPQLHCNLGFSCRELGALDEAIGAFREAVRLDPRDPDAHSNLVYTLNFQPGCQPAMLFAEHREWARRHADALISEAGAHGNDRTPDRRLRVGYVSSHFRGHAVNFFVEPILASHDHDAFEVFCYSAASPQDPDATTARLQRYADHWREIAAHDDLAASELVRRDQIDILVDLAGHIAGNRLGVFARKPAPIQVSYIGYQNTTGMSAIDYRLTDDWSDPTGTTDVFYTEKLVRLPRSFFCYLPVESPEVPPLPAHANGQITFGSFNHFAKVTSQVLDTWCTILSNVPRSRLVLLAPASEGLKSRVLEVFRRHKIDTTRLELCTRRPYREYLDLISRVDVALDPFPFNGHTTTCDSLWMGVPVVTLAGGMCASRFGSSALVTLGLDELVSASVEHYVQIAVSLASDLDRLGQLRATLRQRMAASPLLDFRGFTRNLEAAYRQMWHTWCAGAKS
jgi:predicted O-linked N-acetylglucosamine transferase (SPINDLY family)